MLHGTERAHVTSPNPTINLTLDPIEERNLAHPRNADDRSRALQQTMLVLLTEQLAAKRLPAGTRPPAIP